MIPVKISGTGGVDPVRAYTSQARKEKAGSRDRTGERVPADRLEISSEARKLQYYMELLDKIPTVREELVASLKKRIDEGTYRIDSGKIADGIIRERLMKDKAD